MKTTLCYIEKDGKYLMLFRNKKHSDVNEGKWVGVGGKFRPGESPEECLLREVKEETGLTLTKFHFCGIVNFISDIWENEEMYLYLGQEFNGEITAECDEGTLEWIDKSRVLSLPAWEGDRYFLTEMLNGADKINLTLEYEGDTLIKVLAP